MVGCWICSCTEGYGLGKVIWHVVAYVEAYGAMQWRLHIAYVHPLSFTFQVFTTIILQNAMKK